MSDRIPIEITEAAGDWLDRLSAGTTADQQAFAKWVRISPVHIAEFLRVSALHAELSGALAGHPDSAQALIDQAKATVVSLEDQQSGGVVDGTDAETAGKKQRLTRSGNNLVRWLSAAAVLAMTVAGAFWALYSEGSKTIATELGEQRIVVLPDGSTLELNTDSEVRVRMRETSREIELLRGELLVDGVNDPARPFRVRTDKVVVEAIGTRFNVYRRDEATEVIVLEGRVAVGLVAAVAESSRVLGVDQSPRELDAGLRLVVAQTTQLPQPEAVDVEKATAWTERRLIFDEETVQAVATEFNRYNRARVIVDDPVLAERRISGVFDVNDPAAFVALLGRLEAIEVQLTSEGHRRLRRKHESQE